MGPEEVGDCAAEGEEEADEAGEGDGDADGGVGFVAVAGRGGACGRFGDGDVEVAEEPAVIVGPLEVGGGTERGHGFNVPLREKKGSALGHCARAAGRRARSDAGGGSGWDDERAGDGGSGAAVRAECAVEWGWWRRAGMGTGRA